VNPAARPPAPAAPMPPALSAGAPPAPPATPIAAPAPPRSAVLDPVAASPAAPPAARPEGDAFGEVAAVLAEQLEEVRRGRLDAAHDLASRAGRLLLEARTRGLAPDPDTRDRLGRLYDRIGLALAQQRDELVDRQAHLRRSRASLRAYRGTGA